MGTVTKRRNLLEKRDGRIAIGPIQPAIMPEGELFQMLHQWDNLQDLLGGVSMSPTLPFGKFSLPRWLTPNLAQQREGVFTPPVNVRETDEEFIVEAYLPDVNKKDIHVEVKNGSVLVTKGERREWRHNEKEEDGYLRKEICFHSFYRSFSLPTEVKQEGISAKYEHGIVQICLPKKAEAKAATYSVPLRG